MPTLTWVEFPDDPNVILAQGHPGVEIHRHRGRYLYMLYAPGRSLGYVRLEDAQADAQRWIDEATTPEPPEAA